MRGSLIFLLKYICLLVALLYGVSYFGFGSWFSDVISNFKLQYFCILFIISISGWIWDKKSLTFILAFIVSIGIAVDIQPWVSETPDIVTSQSVTVAGINLLSTNENEDGVVRFIETENPDVLVFTELTPLWRRKLTPHLEDYPHQILKTRTGNFGIGMFSKIPMEKDSIHFFVGGKYGSTFGELTIGDKKVGILGTHPEPPFNKESAKKRNDQFEAIAAHFGTYESPLIIIGDLNCSPYSFHFKELLKNLRLSDSRIKFGILNTWPTNFFPLRIPIDHCLVNEKCKVIERYNGFNIGSDHFPIFAKIAF